MSKQDKLILVMSFAAAFMIPFLFKKKDKDAETHKGTNLKDKNTDGSTIRSSDNISASKAKLIAKQLFEAMQDLGTNDSLVLKLLRPLNGNSLKMVYNAFGTPRYFAGTRSQFLGSRTSLTGWLAAEMSFWDMAEIRKIFKRANMSV